MACGSWVSVRADEAAPGRHCRPSAPAASAGPARRGHRPPGARDPESSVAPPRHARRGCEARRRWPGLDFITRLDGIIVQLARHRFADPRRFFEIVERRALDRPPPSEVHQQRALAVGADAGTSSRVDVVRLFARLARVSRSRTDALRREGAGGRTATPNWAARSARARRANGRFRGPRGRGAGPWTTRDHRHVVDPRVLHHLAHRRQLALAAVDQQQVGPFAARCGRGPPSRAGRSAARAPRASSRNRRPAASRAA